MKMEEGSTGCTAEDDGGDNWAAAAGGDGEEGGGIVRAWPIDGRFQDRFIDRRSVERVRVID